MAVANSADAAKPTIFLLLILFLMFGMAFRLNGQDVTGNIQLNVAFFEARQVGVQFIGVAVIDDIGLELCQRFAVIEAKRIVKEVAFHFFHFTERIVRRNHIFAVIRS